VVSQRIVGEKHLKLTLQVPVAGQAGTAGPLVDAIAFNVEPTLLTTALTRISLAYRIDVNEFRGARNVQLVVATVLDYSS
jgi:single-stranded-DNA-specific exonuclease